MKFSFTDEQLEIASAAGSVLADFGSDDTIKELSESALHFQSDLWQQLAETGMLGLCVGENHGGLGLSLTELCLVLELQGKYLNPVPLLSCLVECVTPLNACDNETLKAALLPAVVSGEAILSPVRQSAGLLQHDPLSITIGDNCQLNGSSGVVPYAQVATGFVITVYDGDGDAHLVYCKAGQAGLSVLPQRMSSGESAGQVSFKQCEISREHILASGDEASALLNQLEQATAIAMAAVQVGVLSESLKRTAEYVTQRKQFGRPLGKFQAVSQQAADAYMAIESLRSVYWRALDDVEHGKDAALSSEVAKFWVGEAGHKVAHTVLHLHGGIGQDISYPVHRFFLWGKHLERYLGTPDDSARKVGGLIAANATAVVNVATMVQADG